MILVLDQNALVYEDAAAYVQCLALPPNIQTVVLRDSEPLDLGNENRAVYIARLTEGGYQYQLDLIRNNSGIGEWIVYAIDCDTDNSIGEENFAIQLRDVSAAIRIYPDPENVRAALGRPEMRKNTCLLIGLNNAVPLEELSGLLEEYLPGWYFELVSATGAGVRNAIEGNACVRTILAGDTVVDFDGADWPDSVKPIIIQTNQEDHIFDSLYSERWRRDLCKWIGVQGRNIPDEHIFQVSTVYEKWRLEIASGDISPASLLMDRRFVMWDKFGLPLLPQAYTETTITTFLNGFTGCKEAAYQIRK